MIAIRMDRFLLHRCNPISFGFSLCLVVQTLRECKRISVKLVLADKEIEGFPEYMTGCECEVGPALSDGY